MDAGPGPLRYEEDDDVPFVLGMLSGDLTVSPIGPLLGAQLSFEGERLGLVFGYTAAFALVDDTGAFDVLHLPAARITYALLAGPRGRLRAEAGVHVAGAPEVTFVAPGVGVSAVLGLIGPLGLEARAFGNVWPFTQLDARAGLSLALSGVVIGAGVRSLYLNDNGVLGSVNAGDTSDHFVGPYANLSLVM
jgi:hypothetical protein